ncbi:MAG: F0F1 ATP synthase subunit delta [Chloroflexi bacterium]|nr:F0F1 ATP synthase subunit delta [Chloroflexota bacterium]
MARTNIRALRFAEAAFAVARDTNTLDAWLEALDQASSLYENHAAELFLTSPVESAEKKRAVLKELLPGVSDDVQRFLAILAHRDRLELVPDIAVHFRRLLNEHRGIAVATVTTAVPIDDRQKAVIASRLGRRLGKTVVLEERVDPSIVGGVIAQVGDTVIDSSIRGRLERLRRTLTA